MTSRLACLLLVPGIFVALLTFGLYAQSTGSGLTQAWVQRYNGPSNKDDSGRALALDAQGNIYVAGMSFRSLDQYTGAMDFVTLKYTPAGQKLWVRRYNGPGNGLDYANGIVVDGAGNAYVTGLSQGDAATGYDYATIKYSPAGDKLWVRRYNGPGNEGDEANAIALDPKGNIIVTGFSHGVNTGADYATIKYSPSGKTLWVKRYTWDGDHEDMAHALAVDKQGNIYVTGDSYDYYKAYDIATIKYSPAGQALWVQRYNGTGYRSSDYGTAIALDGQGNIYVAGRSKYYNSPTKFDYVTVKYSPSGEQLWAKTYNGPGNGDDIAWALAVDQAGNAYVTGWSEGTASTGYDCATIKYSPTGQQLWVRRYNSPGSEWDSGNAIALDAAGNVYVTGSTYGAGTRYDYFTIKYNPAGQQQWVKRYNGPGNRDDDAWALKVDGQGNIYVTGGSYGNGTSRDIATIKYTP